MILFSLFSIKYYFVSCFSMKNMVTHGVCFHVDMLNLNNINFFVLMTVIGDQHFPYQYKALDDPWSLYAYISTSINHFGLTSQPPPTPKKFFFVIVFSEPGVTNCVKKLNISLRIFCVDFCVRHFKPRKSI